MRNYYKEGFMRLVPTTQIDSQILNQGNNFYSMEIKPVANGVLVTGTFPIGKYVVYFETIELACQFILSLKEKNFKELHERL